MSRSAALVVVVMLVWTSSASADEDLGHLEFTVGHPGEAAYGVVAGTYGEIHSGRYPGALFVDGEARAVPVHHRVGRRLDDGLRRTAGPVGQRPSS